MEYKPHKMGDHSDDFEDTRPCYCDEPKPLPPTSTEAGWRDPVTGELNGVREAAKEALEKYGKTFEDLAAHDRGELPTLGSWKPTPQPTSEWEFKFDFVESLDRPLVIKRVRELLRQERQAGRNEAADYIARHLGFARAGGWRAVGGEERI